MRRRYSSILICQFAKMVIGGEKLVNVNKRMVILQSLLDSGCCSQVCNRYSPKDNSLARMHKNVPS